MIGLVWKKDGDFFRARKPTAVGGQYFIGRRRDSDGHGVWHRRREGSTDITCFLSHADTLEHAKAIAQPDDERRKKEPRDRQ